MIKNMKAIPRYHGILFGCFRYNQIPIAKAIMTKKRCWLYRPNDQAKAERNNKVIVKED